MHRFRYDRVLKKENPLSEILSIWLNTDFDGKREAGNHKNLKFVATREMWGKISWGKL